MPKYHIQLDLGLLVYKKQMKFILPLLFIKCERWYITYPIGLGGTLF